MVWSVGTARSVDVQSWWFGRRCAPQWQPPRFGRVTERCSTSTSHQSSRWQAREEWGLSHTILLWRGDSGLPGLDCARYIGDLRAPGQTVLDLGQRSSY
jgi:hypothetical protein